VQSAKLKRRKQYSRKQSRGIQENSRKENSWWTAFPSRSLGRRSKLV